MMEPDSNAQIAPPQAGRFQLSRLIPIAILVAGLGAFFAFDLDSYLTFETLRENRETLSAWVEQYGIIAILIFVLAYIVMVAFSLPGGTLMSITGGFLFGLINATIAIVIGATIGASILFLAAKTAFGDALKAKLGDGNALAKMEQGFKEDAFNYLLVLRLIPLFPFFLVNLVPAFLGVELRTYIIATFIGIIPGAAVYASVGNGLGAIFDRGETPNFGLIFEPEILLPILGLAALALLPVIYKKFFKSENSSVEG